MQFALNPRVVKATGFFSTPPHPSLPRLDEQDLQHRTPGTTTQMDERCKALLPGWTQTRCAAPSDRSNDFCPSHKEERWRLVRAYKEASERVDALKPSAVTTNGQLYALSRYSADELRAAEAATAEYLDAVRAELRGRTTVSERFYANGAQTVIVVWVHHGFGWCTN
uniref:Uncharacterized protein n=1 Tax=Ganoderma boninense TaxID=34458 RepID=A0A5K1K519_9APHY|nr:Uncharacterized protein [Ganoderma boninense]